MQRPTLFEANCFIYWKNRFETYEKSKDIDLWHIIVDGNKKVKDNKIDLFVQKYEEFVISNDQTIDCAFARFNIIITSLKSLDESFSSRTHVRKFLRAFLTRWRPKVTTIEESKDLPPLPLNELIGNLKVYKVVLKKDSKVSRVKKVMYKSLALKARKVSSDEEDLCSRSDEEYAMAVRDFKRLFRQRAKFVCQPHDDKKSFRKIKEEKKGKRIKDASSVNCPKCGNLVDGQYCQGCVFLRKKFKEDLFTYCEENKILQCLLDASEPSNDNTNVVNALQEPFVVKQDPGKNSSQSLPHINHHCCYGCGDSLDGIFCQRCTCKSCGKCAHYGYNCPPKVLIISNLEPCHNQNVDEFPQTLPSFHPTCYSRDENSFAIDSTPNFVNDSPNVFNPPSQPPMYSYEFVGTMLILETKDSLIMEDEHLDTIHEKESDKFIKSSVENIIQNPSEFEDEHELMTSHFLMRTPKEIYSNPPFDEEIISIKIDLRHFNAESDLIKSLLNQDSSIISSSKIDSLLDEFAGELIFLKSIPLRIDEADCDPEEEIRLIEKLFDPFMEEVNLFLTSDGSIPPRIDSDYSDSEGDNLFLERLLHDDPIPLQDILDFSNVIRIFPPLFTYPVTSLIILSSGSEDTIFDP
nr:UBN2 domain-containing protein [Tanacetum cinerariifolium]